MAALALWTVRPLECKVRRETVKSVLEPDEVVVRAEWSGISRGTEALVVHGRVPASEHERMRGPHMAGSFTFPVKYGYSSVGVVEAAGTAASALVGQCVFCLHPHQSRFVVSASSVHVLPRSVPAHRAVLAPNLETAINIVWDAGISLGDRVCVVGAGVVGLLVAFLASRVPGTTVSVVDPQDRSPRLEALEIVNGDDGDFDVVIHASGNPAGLETCLALAGDEALVVEASWHGDAACTVHLGQAFHSRRLTIKSSQVSQLPPSRRPRWDYKRRMALALSFCADSRLDCLLEYPPLEFPQDDNSESAEVFARAYTQLLTPGPHGLCYRIRYAST
ncbi:hypothetical protein CTAYLR_007765 [Chrysophaeum taylorii]|uniref:Dehydrogenase n=1 Tax=Chrysophaeum taylorii TaxID=2483200 RepID=A0AAD7UKI8_9STRA|nr:hypothetical protein CTAYLR_007765 [Chrysophaeum taylorii]